MTSALAKAIQINPDLLNREFQCFGLSVFILQALFVQIFWYEM